MKTVVNLYSEEKDDITNFLSRFYKKNNLNIDNPLKWEKQFDNPIEITDILGVFIENNDDFNINMWISLDEGVFINITEDNVDNVIRYLFERYPY